MGASATPRTLAYSDTLVCAHIYCKCFTQSPRQAPERLDFHSLSISRSWATLWERWGHIANVQGLFALHRCPMKHLFHNNVTDPKVISRTCVFWVYVLSIVSVNTSSLHFPWMRALSCHLSCHKCRLVLFSASCWISFLDGIS